MKIEEQDGRAKREDVCPSKKGKLDLDSLRAQINEANEKAGPEYWRSLEELAGSPAFQEALHREFPKGASEWVDSQLQRLHALRLSRRGGSLLHAVDRGRRVAERTAR